MIKIETHKYRVRCDVNRCSNQDVVAIGEEGGPLAARFICCKSHLEQIILNGIEYFGENAALKEKLMKVLQIEEQADTNVHEELKIANDTITALKVEMEGLKKKLAEKPKKTSAKGKLASRKKTVAKKGR